MNKLILVIVAAVLLVACKSKLSGGESGYTQISQDAAKEMMDKGGVIVLDVREESEYSESHISGAVLLPVGTINESTAAAVIPSKDDVVLVYCRSGNRSKTASEKLAQLGYTNICEFGGINSWKYGVEK